MQLGLVGLGKMGFNMRARLRQDGRDIVGYDPRPEVSDVASLGDVAGALDAPRDEISGYTEDSGEGRWTVEEAIRLRVPVPSIAAALFARFLSRQDDSPTMKAVAALRNQFGGHAVKRVSESG